MTIVLKNRRGSILKIHDCLTFGNQRPVRHNYFLVYEGKDIDFYYEKLNNKNEVYQVILDYKNQGFQFKKLKQFYNFLFKRF